MDNPVRTFDWKAQFDDAKLRGPYENLSKHEATEFACYLFEHGDIAAAEELLPQDLSIHLPSFTQEVLSEQMVLQILSILHY